MTGCVVEEIGWVGVQGKTRVILSSGPGGLGCRYHNTTKRSLRLYGGLINNLGRLILSKILCRPEYTPQAC